MLKNKSSRWRIFKIITVALTVIIFYGISFALFGMTLVRPVWIICESAALAAVATVLLRKRWDFLVGCDSLAVNLICHILAFTGLFMALILGVNYFGRNKSQSVPVHAEVVKVYSETHYRQKRVARNRYTRSEPYSLYFMDVRLPDGRQRKRAISLQQYNRYAAVSHTRHNRPDSIGLRLTPGALGMMIIEKSAADD